MERVSLAVTLFLTLDRMTSLPNHWYNVLGSSWFASVSISFGGGGLHFDWAGQSHPSSDVFQFTSQVPSYCLSQRYSTFSVCIPPDVTSLQLYTPKSCWSMIQVTHSPQCTSEIIWINYIQNNVLNNNIIKIKKQQRYFNKAKLY
jgi:hypothetical protein